MFSNHTLAWFDCASTVQACRDLEVYRTLLTKGGRIVFEVAVDYSQTARIWKDMIRLWVCLSIACLLISPGTSMSSHMHAGNMEVEVHACVQAPWPHGHLWVSVNKGHGTLDTSCPCTYLALHDLKSIGAALHYCQQRVCLECMYHAGDHTGSRQV